MGPKDRRQIVYLDSLAVPAPSSFVKRWATLFALLSADRRGSWSFCTKRLQAWKASKKGKAGAAPGAGWQFGDLILERSKGRGFCSCKASQKAIKGGTTHMSLHFDFREASPWQGSRRIPATAALSSWPMPRVSQRAGRKACSGAGIESK